MEFMLGIPFGAALGCLLASIFCLAASYFHFSFSRPAADTLFNIFAANTVIVLVCGPIWKIRTVPFWLGTIIGMLLGTSLLVSQHAA